MRGLIEGTWHRHITGDHEAPVFGQAGFRHEIPSARFPAEAGRYHLYVSYACPFAHRAILARQLNGLTDAISMSVCDPWLGGPHGWWFRADQTPDDFADVTPDQVNRCRYLYKIYTLAAYLEWHLRRALAPLLFDDETLERERATRDPVAPAKPTPHARRKKAARRSDDGWPVHRFASLLAELATRCRNTCRFHHDPDAPAFMRLTEPTELQRQPST